MKFSVNPKIFEKFPGVEIGVLVITGMDNQGYNGEILNLLRAEEKHQKEILTGVELGTLPEISAWRRIYKSFGSGGDYRSSVETLLRRARGGMKPLPNINNLVNLYNFLSLKYHLPAGAEDLDKVKGSISLTFSKGEEKGVCLGGSTEETCEVGEVIYKDDLGFICRRWNYREADRTKIDKETENAVLVLEKIPEINQCNFQDVLHETGDLVKKLLSAKVDSFILKKGNENAELNLKSGVKINANSRDSDKPQKNISQKSGPFYKKEEFPILGKIKWENISKEKWILKNIIFSAISKIENSGIKATLDDIKIEHPNEKNYGDYSTNFALINASRLRQQPKTLAEKISEVINDMIRRHQSITLQTDSKTIEDNRYLVSDILEKSNIAGQGFINLHLSKQYLISQAVRLLEIEKSVNITQMKNMKISVEYTDPNPFKEFHLGHLYSNVIGEAVSRMLEVCGAIVWRGDFYGDVGMHVAKSVWGMINKMQAEDITLKDLEKLSIKERQHFLGKGYALGVIKYDEDKKVQEEIKEINLLVYVAAQEILKESKGWQPIVNYRQYIKGKEEKLPLVRQVYEAGLRWSLEYFESIYKRLGTKFDGYYPESWVGEYGMKMVEKGLEKGVLEKSEGGVVYRGEQDGFHTRVFVNSLGLPTYEAKDLGLARAKYQDFKYDLSINIFGKEIDEYYKVVRAAMKKIEPELGEKASYIAHGMVRLPGGKMSSRTGNVITYEGLLAEAKKLTLKIMDKVELGKSEKQNVAELVGIGAVRYALLKSNIGTDVVFDFDKSISFEGDSGPYLQYTYARCRSVLRKSKCKMQNAKVADTLKYKAGDAREGIPNSAQNIGFEHYLGTLEGQPARNCFAISDAGGDPQININPEELSLLRVLYRFPEVVAEAVRTLSPNIICGFLFELAQGFNLFYSRHSILQPTTNNQQPTTDFRLMLTRVTSEVLKKGLYLLGIETVERM